MPHVRVQRARLLRYGLVKDDRRYWDRHAKNYDRSIALLGGPMPRMVQHAGEGYCRSATSRASRSDLTPAPALLVRLRQYLKPVVGQQVTVTRGAPPAALARLDLLLARARGRL